MTFKEINQTLQTVAQSQARFDKTVKQIAEAHKTLIELLRVQDGRIDSHDMSRREADERIDAIINSQVRADEHIEALINSQARTDESIEALINSQARTDEGIEALINAQVRYEARQEKLEVAYRQVAVSHTQIVEMLRLHENRLDRTDVANAHTADRFDALINSQIQLTEQVDTLTRDIEAINGRAAEHEASQEKLEESFRLVASSHSQLVEIIRLHERRLDGDDEAQARTDGRVDALIDDQISARAQAEERGRLLDEKLARLQEAQAQADEQIRMLAARNGGAK
jgi:chromosome segregation ATPase